MVVDVLQDLLGKVILSIVISIVTCDGSVQVVIYGNEVVKGCTIARITSSVIVTHERVFLREVTGTPVCVKDIEVHVRIFGIHDQVAILPVRELYFVGKNNKQHRMSILTGKY